MGIRRGAFGFIRNLDCGVTRDESREAIQVVTIVMSAAYLAPDRGR